jgi:hypothetical protein
MEAKMLAIIKQIHKLKQKKGTVPVTKRYYKLDSINGVYPDGVVRFFSPVNLIDYLIDLVAEDAYNESKMLGYKAEAADLIVWFHLPYGELKAIGEMEATTIAALLEEGADLAIAKDHLERLRTVVEENNQPDSAAVIPISEEVLVDKVEDTYKN